MSALEYASGGAGATGPAGVTGVTGPTGPGGGSTFEIAQTAHGFAVGDVVRRSTAGGGTYVKAQADTEANAEVVGMASAVADANNFSLITNGLVTGLSGLTDAAIYYLSPATAGAVTATETTTVGQVSKPVLLARGTTSGYFFNMRGIVVAAPAEASVIIAPATSARNVIQPTGAAVVPLTLKGAASQTANLHEWQDSAGSVLAKLTNTGNLVVDTNTLVVDATNNVVGVGVAAPSSLAKLHVYRNDSVISGLKYGALSQVDAKGLTTVSERTHAYMAYIADAAGVANKTITAMSRSGTTVTVTATAHGFANGDQIAIYGVTHTFDVEVNGRWVVANAAANTFDITVTGLSSGTYTSGGTATNRPMMTAFAATVAPAVARGGLTGTAANADDLNGFTLYNGGTVKATTSPATPASRVRSGSRPSRSTVTATTESV